MHGVTTPSFGKNQRMAGPGQPLPDGIRAVLERGLGADLSAVRVHTSHRADLLTRRLGADAFTHGAEAWRYDPDKVTEKDVTG
jgi:Domain of unknown function (DUF4157)